MAEQGTDFEKTEDAAVAEAETIRKEDQRYDECVR